MWLSVFYIDTGLLNRRYERYVGVVQGNLSSKIHMARVTDWLL